MNEPIAPRIAPCLWLDDQAESAAQVYARVFPDSRVVATSHYPAGFENPSGKPRGSVMTVEMELAGTRFTALNGGPMFTINPTISFFVRCAIIDEVERIAKALVEGGAYLMELGEYPWSPRYAWVQDRFGVSWQVIADPESQFSTDGPGRGMIAPCLMFAGDAHGRAEEALRRYAASFPGGSVVTVEHYAPGEGPADTLKHGRASLGAGDIITMDSHLEHEARFNEGVSLQVLCRSQEEVDTYWRRLTDGGAEGPCGWLTDRFGVSWQVVPTAFYDLLRDNGDQGPGYERAYQAMLGMTKPDVAVLMAAYEGP